MKPQEIRRPEEEERPVDLALSPCQRRRFDDIQ
jgi:hypothetical protein